MKRNPTHPLTLTLTLLLTLTPTNAQNQTPWIHQPHNPQTQTPPPQWIKTNKTLIHPHATATIHTHNNIITHITATYTNTPESTNAISQLISLTTTGNTNQTNQINQHLQTNPPPTLINNTILTTTPQPNQTTTITLTPQQQPTTAFRATRHYIPATEPDAPTIRIYLDLGCLECNVTANDAVNNILNHPTPKRIEFHHAPVISKQLGTAAARAVECVTAANPDAGVGFLLGLLREQRVWVDGGAVGTVFLQLALEGGLGIGGVVGCLSDELTVREVEFAVGAAGVLGVVDGVTVFVEGFRMVDPGSLGELNRLLLVVLPELLVDAGDVGEVGEVDVDDVEVDVDDVEVDVGDER
jgi:protein-disulfide isomerase